MRLARNALRPNPISPQPFFLARWSFPDSSPLHGQTVVRNLESSRLFARDLPILVDQFLSLEVGEEARLHIVELFLPATVLQAEHLGPLVQGLVGLGSNLLIANVSGARSHSGNRGIRPQVFARILLLHSAQNGEF